MMLQSALYMTLFGAVCALRILTKEESEPQLVSDNDPTMICELYPQLELCTDGMITLLVYYIYFDFDIYRNIV